MANYQVDLHTHTVRSDGNDTIEQLVHNALAAGLKAVAVTDHDVGFPKKVTLADGNTVDPVIWAASLGLILIPGMEFSCDTMIDDVHIVGLGCNFEHPSILAAEREAEESKVGGYIKLTEILTENGMPLDWQRDVLNATDPPRRPEGVQRKHVFEAMAAKGYTKDWSAAKLMVLGNPVYNYRREKFDPIKVIATIHAAGGIAILAHPWLIADEVPFKGEPTDRFGYIERLIAAGLDGIEAAYPYEKTSYDRPESSEQVARIVREKYGNRLKIISGGSDYHNDKVRGAIYQRNLGEGGITWEYFCSNSLLKRFIPSPR